MGTIPFHTQKEYYEEWIKRKLVLIQVCLFYTF